MVPQAVDVVMPQLGESIVEGTVVRWAVAVGQTVRRGELLAEVETDKATSEIPASIDGVIEALLVEEGQTVPVGQAVARLKPPGTAAMSGPSTTKSPSASPAPPSTKPELSLGRLPNRRLIDQPAADGTGGPRRTSPAVRRLAREHGVDVHAIAGSGHRGRVTRDDVLSALQTSDGGQSQSNLQVATVTSLVAEPAPPRAPPGPGPTYRPGARDKVEPLSRRRRLIAQNLRRSIDTAAHVATVAEIDMHSVYAARAIDGPHCAAEGLRLTVLAYVVQAVAQTLSEVPLLNATIQGEQLVLRGDRNVGIAVDTPSGIIVPVIRRADELGLLGIARAIEALSERARNGTVTADDLSEGSFTISNPGREGNLFGVSIIRQPEVGILRIGSVVKRPVVRTIDGDDAIVIRPIMYGALSYDHRLIDGRTGNGFLFRLARRLEATRPTFGPPTTN